MSENQFTDAFRNELVSVFAVEAEEMLDLFEQKLLELEQRPDDDEVLREIFRAAHTLKGNASCLQYDELTRFAHAVEELLGAMRDGKAEITGVRISRLLEAVDALRTLSTRSVAGPCALTGAEEQLLSDLMLSDGGQAGVPVLHTSVRASNTRTLRVDTGKLDRMLDLAGEIAVARGHLWQLLVEQNCDEQSLDTLRELDRLSFDLQETIMSVRLVPVGPAFRHFHRVVRDLSASRGKGATLVLEGEDVEVDTTVIDHLRDPMTHMIRNAIDHGIEAPEVRVQKGKSAAGTVRIAAAHEAGGIVIRVSDDGAGLDAARIAARAREIGLNTDRMTPAELFDLIFAPGFTTASEVTDISGRGVGMDVVRRNIEALRGSVAIETVAGAGTTFVIRLPLTLAVIDGFGVSAAGETYVIPMETVLECIELPSDQPKDAQTGILPLRGDIVPYVRLRSLFAHEGEGAQRENVLIVQDNGRRAGLVVDSLHGASQAVIKPLGRFFARVPAVAGSSILGDGRVALILDPPAIFRGLISQ